MNETGCANARLNDPRRQRAGALTIGFASCLLAGTPAVTLAETPDDNNALAAGQGALMGAHLGGMAGGVFAPGPFGTGFEVAAMVADIGLKNLAPIFEIPSSYDQFPNAVRTGDLSGRACVYRFAETVRAGDDVLADGYTAGIEEGFASIFYVPFDPLDDVFADIGKPAVYHVGADVRVRATNPYLGAGGYSAYATEEQRSLQQRPEFPAGVHDISWSATTTMNAVLDIAVPAALIPFGIAAENYAAKKAAVASAKGTRKPLSYFIASIAADAAELGLIAADISGVAQSEAWYESTSFDTASNRATQTLTVWDTALPYVRDLDTGLDSIAVQDIELQARDFGGILLRRAENDLRSRFAAIDDCGESFDIVPLSDGSRLFPIDGTEELEWEIRERDGGPYHPDTLLNINQEREGSSLVTRFTQRVRVVDTQAPILIPPAGFARYDEDGIDLTSEAFPLGRPRVVDLADPSPTVSNSAPDFLPGPPAGADGVRYDITWDAQDGSGNSALATAGDPSTLVQTITLKRPGTNTAPQAVPTTASTVSSAPVDIVLQGIDVDDIGGRVDPLEFEIDEQPPNGQFEAPLLPYFIEDYRLTPVGEREEGDNLTRVSPLKHLADAFRLEDPSVHGTFLNQEICNAPAGSLSDTEFGGVIPVNMVYEPTYVYADDDGFYYIRDSYYVCGETNKLSYEVRGELPAIPRLSKWTETGELVATVPLYVTDDPSDLDGHLNNNIWPGRRFSVDHNDRLWVTWAPIFSTFGSSATHYSYGSDLTDVQYHGNVSYNETETILGEGLRGVASDGNTNLLYELVRAEIRVRDLGQIVELGNQVAPEGFLDVSQIDAVGDFNSGSNIGDDIAVDRDGNVFVLDRSRNRIHKWGPTVADGQGGWVFGEYVGWMGSCTANKTIDGTPTGVPYNACDVATGTSRGYACADHKCERAADTAGSGNGQFSLPNSIEISPKNVLYVADTGNSRVQRFGQDGTFAGEAVSTGTGINQGDEPGFILGNMGEPSTLSVNSTSFFVMESAPANGDFFVHVFRTLPFRDVTPSSATVRYVSDFNFRGDDFFTYRVDDGIDKSDSVRVDVSVARAFRPPEDLVSQCYASTALDVEVPCTVAEDNSLYIRLSASDPDGFASDFPDGLDTLEFEVNEAAAHGTLEVADPELVQDNSTVLRYTPDANYHGDDAFRFTAFDGSDYAAADAGVELVITPVADPVIVEFEDELRAARGFNSVVRADFSDADETPGQQATLLSFNWGDGVVASGSGWSGSGQEDLNGREISPQVDFGSGSGMLIGTHDYDSTGAFTVTATMAHDPSDGLPDVAYSATVTVLDVTAVTIDLADAADNVTPDVPFPLTLTVQNLAPSSWAGLTAANVGIAFDVPEGLAVTATDARCTGTTRIACALGDLAPGETTDVLLGGLVTLAAAREEASYGLLIDITDDGPNLRSDNIAKLGIDVADSDGDGVVDALDAFPDDPRYADDTDGDGLADEWEAMFGLDPDTADDVTADIDGDGYTLLEEFVNGSFPFRADKELSGGGNRLEIADYAFEDRFGLAMAGGDLNDDGFADVVIGASSYQPPGVEGEGAVFIAWGTANGASPALEELRGGNDTPYGQSVAIGDWDDNGLPDLAIAASRTVYIHWNNGDILETPDLALTWSLTPGRLTVHSDDLDGDGVDDLIVNQFVSGETRINFYRSSDGGIDSGGVLFNALAGDYFGHTVGDVDGDGAADLLLANSADGVLRGYLGADNNFATAVSLVESFSLSAPAGQGRFGHAIAAGGDVTGDGIDDLVVGAYTGGGFINLYNSESAYLSDPSTPPLQTISGEPVSTPGNGTHGDQFGVSLAMAHLDRDGFADLVVGANRAGGADEGQLRILHGSPAGFVNEQVENGSTGFDLLGHYVIVPGDVDGDGVADIAGGASDVVTAQNPSPDGGYVQMLYHRYEAATAGDDDDGDGVGTALDNCPADPNTNQSDIDGDDIGDACDDDIDGDGFTNNEDNCPLDNSLDMTDTDGDLDGDICDSDDDNDAVADADDAFPLNAAYANDDDNDGMADEWEADNGLDSADGSDGDADLDGDGRNNRDEFLAGTNVAADDVAPVVTAPGDVLVDSIGPLTVVDVGTATAIDVLDGPLEATASAGNPFKPGLHQLDWTASDAAGNSASDRQRIEVVPQVGFLGDTLLVAEGSVYRIGLALNGDAVAYPASVPFTVSGTATDGADYTLDTGEVVFSNSTVGEIVLTTIADAVAEAEEELVITLGSPFNAVAAGFVRFTVRIIDGNLPPVPEIAIEQDGRRVTTVARDAGQVTVSAAANDPNAGDSHAFDWRASDTAIAPVNGYDAGTFDFDPATLAPGTYRVAVAVTDNGAATATQSRILRVIDTLPVLSTANDADGDGLDDASEELRDSNDNGVSDYLDPVFVSHNLLSRSGGNALLQADAGYVLSLGRIALASGEDAMVSMMDVAEFGDAGGQAVNGMDERFSYTSGIVDFEVRGLPAPGHAVRVVIPQSAPLPAGTRYRKYTTAGWADFVTDALNAVASAPGEPGICPAPGSSDYQPGLTAGHHCVQLTIADGGPNDADGTADRILRDPGGAAVLAVPANVDVESVATSNSSVSRGQANVVMMRFRLSSNTSDVTLDALQLSASGSGNDAADIAAVELWLDADGDGAIDSGASPIGSGTFGSNDGDLTITLGTPLTLDAGTTAFIVTYDF